MPPDDPLFTSPKPNGSGTPTPPAATPPAATGLSAEQVAQLIQQQQAPLLESINTLGQQIGALVNRPAHTPAEPTNVSGADAASKFLENPDAFVNDIVMRSIKNVVQPVVGRQLMGQFSSHKDSLKARIDTQYGPGTWDSIYEKPFTQRADNLRQSDPSFLSDPSVLNEWTNSITGANMDALHERKAKLTTDATARANAEREALVKDLMPKVVTLTGGTSMFNPDKPELTDAHKLALSEIEKATGEKQNEAQMAKLMAALPPGSRTSESDWEAFKATEAKAAKANGSATV